MKILALDCTSSYAAVALCDGDKLLSSYFADNDTKHSEALLPAVEFLLKQNHITVDQLDMIACAVGPGAFTGVRICACVAKGLAFGKNIPCVPVSTIQALAYNCTHIDGIISPVMDARRGQLYNAIFQSHQGKLTRLTPDRLITADALARELSEHSDPIYFCGDGSYIALQHGIASACLLPPLLTPNSAFSVAQVALEKYNAQPNDDYCNTTLAPVYLRASQAEREQNIN